MAKAVYLTGSARKLLTAAMAALAAIAAPLSAQPMPDPGPPPSSAPMAGGVDGDLAGAPQDAAPAPRPAYAPPPTSAPPPAPYGQAQPMAMGPASSLCGRGDPANHTYQSDDLIGAATGVFGSGSRGLASLIRDILRKQGAPDGYIAGREAGGAFVAGLRYGSGTLCQKQREPLPVYWTGPSIGFDVGANAAKTFVLVYNLDNPADLFRRFGAGEGQAYFVGGFNVSYLRRGSVVLIPVRLGVGLRLGINGGYMKLSRHQNWLPF